MSFCHIASRDYKVLFVDWHTCRFLLRFSRMKDVSGVYFGSLDERSG